MFNHDWPRKTGRVVAAAATLSMATLPAAASGVGPSGVTVHTALGGMILGYDVDQGGKDGILAEFLTLQDGSSDVAVETFDQKTGKIIKIVKEEKNTLNDFDANPIVGSGIGLVEYQKQMHNGSFRNIYELINPLSRNRLDGKWTPMFGADEEIWSVSEDQGQSTTAIMTIAMAAMTKQICSRAMWRRIPSAPRSRSAIRFSISTMCR